MTELVEWLRGQLDEDARVARAVKETTREWQLREDVPSERDGVTYTLLGLDDDVFAGWDGHLTLAEAEHIARHDPARVLREVEAKRAIVDEHHPIGPSAGTEDKVVCNACGPEEDIGFRVETYGRGWPCRTLRLLASVHSARPGYREE